MVQAIKVTKLQVPQAKPNPGGKGQLLHPAGQMTTTLRKTYFTHRLPFEFSDKFYNKQQIFRHFFQAGLSLPVSLVLTVNRHPL